MGRDNDESPSSKPASLSGGGAPGRVPCTVYDASCTPSTQRLTCRGAWARVTIGQFRH